MSIEIPRIPYQKRGIGRGGPPPSRGLTDDIPRGRMGPDTPSAPEIPRAQPR